jgi:hypothetical protein
MFGEETTVF